MVLRHTRQSYTNHMKHLVTMSLLNNTRSISANLTETSSDSVSFTNIFSDVSSPSDNVVFWLILVVALLLLMLKAAKYILKWKNKKLSTADTLAQLNTVLVESMKLLSTRAIPPSAASVLIA